MPRLRSLHVRLKVEGSAETVTALTRIIKVQLGKQLKELNLDMHPVFSENATELFSELGSLRTLKLNGCATAGVLDAVAGSHMPYLTSIACTATITSYFDDATLSALGRRLSTQLQDFSASYFLLLTSAGLIDFAEHCRSLTRLNLEGCILISPIGFETLIEASPFLTYVYLNGTNVNDASLLKLSTPLGRASRLETLSVRQTGVTTDGIADIVRSCRNLRELDIGFCSRVTFKVFEEPAWECTRLENLMMSGLGRGTSRNNSDQLSNMYRQLGRLSRLHTLHLNEYRFNLKLFDMGYEALEQLERIVILRISGLIHPPSKREIIWLATRFKSLRELKLDRRAVEPSLLEDLMAINRNLQILLSDKLKYRLSPDSDDEPPSDLDRPSHNNEHPSNFDPPSAMESDIEDTYSMDDPYDINPFDIAYLDDDEDPYGGDEEPYDLYGYDSSFDMEDPYNIDGPYNSETQYDIEGLHDTEHSYDAEDLYGMENPSELNGPSDIEDPPSDLVDELLNHEDPSSDALSEHGLLQMDTDSDLSHQPDPDLWNYRSDRSEDSDIQGESEEDEEEKSDVEEDEEEGDEEDEDEEEEETYPLCSDPDQDHSTDSENNSHLYSNEPSDMGEDEEHDSEDRSTEDEEAEYSSHSDMESDNEEEDVIESSDEQASEHSDSAAEDVVSESDDSPESDPDAADDSSSDEGQEDDLEEEDLDDSDEGDQEDFSEDD